MEQNSQAWSYGSSDEESEPGQAETPNKFKVRGNGCK